MSGSLFGIHASFSASTTVLHRLVLCALNTHTHTHTHTHIHNRYEKSAKDLEASRSVLEKEVKEYRDEVAAYESK